MTVGNLFDKKSIGKFWGNTRPTKLDQGGGFFPLSDFPEYRKQRLLYDNNHIDVIQNMIWRPRRLGEELGAPLVDIDGLIETSFEEQRQGGTVDETGFNGWVDGGYDCGRSPFPTS